MVYVRIAAILLALALPFQAYADDNIRKITVTGKSEITVEAQYAVIRLEVRQVTGDMGKSHDKMMETVTALSEGLKRLGVADNDIRKSLVMQGIEYSWTSSTRVREGYYSGCAMEVSVKDMGRIADIYKALAEHDDVTIYDTEYKRDDKFDIRMGEFTKALLAAQKKAEHMATTLGAGIGKVHSIQEINSGDYQAANMYANSIQDGQAKTSAGYGNIKISAQVAIEFELE